DNDEQMKALRRVLEYDAQSITARLAIASLYTATNQLNEAIKEYEQLVNLPGAPDTAAVDMVRLMITRKQRTPADKPGWPEIGQVIANIEKRYPTSVEVLLAKSDFLMARGQAREAGELLASACAARKEVRWGMQWAHCAEQVDQSGLKLLDEAVTKLGDHPELRLKRAALLVGRSPLIAQRELRQLEQVPASYKEEQKNLLLTGL